MTSTRWRGLFGVLALLGLLACGPAQPDEPVAGAEEIATPEGTGGVNHPVHRNAAHLVLISLDGFRADYLDRFDLPNIRRLLQRGTRAEAMIPVFPSLTFPNHYSLVTGLYPEKHGLVANTFFDPARGQVYSLGNREAVEDGTWYGGEPLWVTAETQGMVAACFFWPGSEAAIRGVRPTYWHRYDGEIPNQTRVDTVLDWLRLPQERRPHVITLYFSDVDSISHRRPLDSPDIEKAARSLDRTLGRLFDGIDALAIRDRVHVILSSDHGMVETSTRHVVRLDSLVDTRGVHRSFGGPVANLHVRGGAARATALRDGINAGLRHGRAYLRDDVPERLRYRDNPRIGDVVVIMNESWTMTTGSRQRDSQEDERDRWGMHGWDPELPSMHAIFAISGPGIRQGARIGRVRNVDVYPLMAELLGLRTPEQLDGRPGVLYEQVVAAGTQARTVAPPSEVMTDLWD